MRHANMVASVPVETKRTCSAQGTAWTALRQPDRRLGEPEEGGAPRDLLLDRPDQRRMRVPEEQGAGSEDVVEVGAGHGGRRAGLPRRATTNESSGGRLFWPRHPPGRTVPAVASSSRDRVSIASRSTVIAGLLGGWLAAELFI